MHISLFCVLLVAAFLAASVPRASAAHDNDLTRVGATAVAANNVDSAVAKRSIEADDEDKDKEGDKDKKDDGDDDGDVCDFATQKQKLKIEAGGKAFQSENEAESGKCGIKTTIKFGCDGQCLFEGKFKDKASDTEKKSGLKVVLRKLLEIDGVGADHTEVASTDIGDFEWADLTCRCGADGAEGASNSVLQACTEAIECKQVGTLNNAELTMNFFIAAQPVNLTNGYQVRANAIKFDFALTDWAYESASNYLALDAAVTTKAKLAKESEDDADETETEGEKERKYKRGTKHVRGIAAVDSMGLWWEPTYESGDASYNVSVIDNPQTSDEKRVLFVFTNAGGDINWDPEVSMGGAYSSTSGATKVIITQFAMLMAFALLSLYSML